MKGKLVNEAKSQYFGVSIDKTQWNKVENKGEIIYLERAPNPKSNLTSEIKFSSSSVNAPHKHRCGLCQQYFHKESVNYSVPNHRIVDLQKVWGLPRTGKKYESASFLYTISFVCRLCSQLFEEPETCIIDSTSHELQHNPSQLTLSKVKRSNIAEFQRTYQSSVVDHLESQLAVIPPPELPSTFPPIDMFGSVSSSSLQSITSSSTSNLSTSSLFQTQLLTTSLPPSRPSTTPHNKTRKCHSKTRREVDPWWEMDFCSTQHVHSLSFSLLGGPEAMKINVMLLKQPLGFENPFLDSVLSLAVCSTSFSTTVKPGREMTYEFQSFEWSLPPHSLGCAIRFQLSGLHTLALQHIQVYQGDDLVKENLPSSIPSTSSSSSFKPPSGSPILSSLFLSSANNKPENNNNNNQAPSSPHSTSSICSDSSPSSSSSSSSALNNKSKSLPPPQHLSFHSFATLSPQRMREGFLEMMSNKERRIRALGKNNDLLLSTTIRPSTSSSLSHSNTISLSHTQSHSSSTHSSNNNNNHHHPSSSSSHSKDMAFQEIRSFSRKIQSRYESLSHWKEKIRTTYLPSLHLDEFTTLYHLVFLPVTVEKALLSSIPLPSSSTSSSNYNNNNNTLQFPSASSLAQLGKPIGGGKISLGKMPLEVGLFDAGLLLNHPRGDLTDLNERLQTIFRWLQMKSHGPQLGSLLFNEKMKAIVNDLNDIQFRISSHLKLIDVSDVEKTTNF